MFNLKRFIVGAGQTYKYERKERVVLAIVITPVRYEYTIYRRADFGD